MFEETRRPALEMRWVPTTDQDGRPVMVARWQVSEPPTTAAVPAAGSTRAA